ncbi:SGNH/GDSL hydrolase family protein [Gordonia sinesedis]
MKYVALGSSYAAGPGATPNVGELCLRGDNSYPRAVAAARELTLVDVTCSGATVANILDVPQHPAADRPQIEAVTPDTDLVTITIGGNDISYVGRVIAMSCANSVPELARTVAARGCSAGRDPAPEPAPDAYARVERSMVAVVDAVRARAPRAIVVLVDYPAVVSVDEAPCPQLPLTPEQVVETQRIADGLAGATARAAATSGALVVTASKASATHTVCSTAPWVRGFALPIPYHPNAAGKSAVAQLVLDGLGNRIR